MDTTELTGAPQPAFQLMAKPAGPACNLACRYCFYREKAALYPDRASWRMGDAVLESFTRQYIGTRRGAEAEFAWQGGEPTLAGLDFFRKAVELQARYADGKAVRNAFQTNGILLDDAWCSFLAENRFLVGLSLDGPPELNDRWRRDAAGAPTAELVLRAAERLRSHGVEFNILCAVHRDNAGRPRDVYSFLKGLGTAFLQFIPLVERPATGSARGMGLALEGPAERSGAAGGPAAGGPAAPVTAWSVTPGLYGSFLCGVFDEWVRSDVGRVYVQLFDTALGLWTGHPSPLCVYAQRCGRAMVLEHNGDLYSCDHYVYPGYRLGNIMDTPLADLAALPFQKAFGDAKADGLPGRCRDCRFLFACRGGCPKHRFLRTPEGEPGWNYLCAAYQAFFDHAGDAMGAMARLLSEGRPPALVMERVRVREVGRRLASAGRNDPCPCGSGRKFKNCHGRA